MFHIINPDSLVSGKSRSDEFLRLIQRELKIRFFTVNTVKGYVSGTRRFLNWFGRLPHQVKREDVREYLEVLVDGGASSSHVGTTLSSLRTDFDKMCCRRTTLGNAVKGFETKKKVAHYSLTFEKVTSAARPN